MIGLDHIEHVGDRELVNVDGTVINSLRLDCFLKLSTRPEHKTLFLIVPRHTKAPVGLLA
jgi:chemotaxis protein histidine kinase CheA